MNGKNWLYTATTGLNARDFEITAPDVRETAEFIEFRERVYRTIENAQSVNYRMFREFGFDAYLLGLALDDLRTSRRIIQIWGGYCTLFEIPCAHGNQRGLCFETECMR